jgi:hypothetical protein
LSDEKMFVLTVGGKTGEEIALETNCATIKLGWALTKKGLSVLKEKEILYAYMLIVISVSDHENGGYIEDTHLVVPLHKRSTYVSFLRPGENYIHTSIVTREDESGYRDDLDDMMEYYLERNDFPDEDYCEQLIDHQGKFCLSRPYIGYQIASANVAKELFAPTPSSWQVKLIKLVYGDKKKLIDQCQMRKLLLGILPIMIGYSFKTVWRLLVVLVGLSVPLSKIDFRPLTDPRKMSYKDIWEGAEPVWVHPFVLKNGKSYVPWYLFLLSPLYLFSVFLMTYIMYRNKQIPNLDFGIYSKFYIGVTAGIFAVIVCSVSFMYIHELDEKRRAKIQENVAEAGMYRGLVEGEVNNKYDLKLVLKSKLFEIKSMVCKPFARN